MAITTGKIPWIAVALMIGFGSGCAPVGDRLDAFPSLEAATTTTALDDERWSDLPAPLPPARSSPPSSAPPVTDPRKPRVPSNGVTAGGAFSDVFGPPTGRLDADEVTSPDGTIAIEATTTTTPPATTTPPVTTAPPDTAPVPTDPPTTSAPPTTTTTTTTLPADEPLPPTPTTESPPPGATLATTRTTPFSTDIGSFVREWNDMNARLVESTDIDVGTLMIDEASLHSGDGLADDGTSYSVTDPIDGGFLAMSTDADGQVTAVSLYGSTGSGQLFDALMTMIVLTDADPDAVIDSTLRATESNSPFDEVFATGADGHWRVRLEDDIITVTRVATSDSGVARLTSDLLLLDAVIALPTPDE